MFKASSPPDDLPPGWTGAEFDRYREYMGDNWLPSPDIGHNGPPSDRQPDPLAGMTKKQIFTDCIWISDEGPTTKLVLLCVSRFFNADAMASSMAYSQIEADCGLSDRAVKGAVAEAESDETAPATRKAKAVRKGAQAARERWLLIERQKGFRTASGPQNLYHGIVPERWIAKLRQLRSGGVSVETDERIVRAADAVTASLNGVKQVHPSPLNGVHQVHPSKPEGVQYVHPSDQRGEPGASKGCITCTLTLNTPKRETPTEEVPLHLNRLDLKRPRSLSTANEHRAPHARRPLSSLTDSPPRSSAHSTSSGSPTRLAPTRQPVAAPKTPSRRLSPAGTARARPRRRRSLTVRAAMPPSVRTRPMC